jgi:hypothetical protein
MRYLKTYNLFESKTDAEDFEDLIQNIEDILLPISDMDNNPYVQENSNPNEIIIRIVIYGDKTLEVTNEVKDEFDRLNDYLDSKGYSITLVRGVTVFDANLDLTYDEFSKYLKNGLSIKSFRNLLFVVNNKNYEKALR